MGRPAIHFALERLARRALLCGALCMLMAGASTAQDTVDVVPMEEWLRFEEVEISREVLPLVLRAGYERPVIFPEPVTLTTHSRLPGSSINIEEDVAVFAPGQRFEPVRVEFLGKLSGRRYRFDVSATPFGKRIPVRLVLR